jgi:hypothetical protein
MPAFTVVVTVVALLVGGQTLFLEVLRIGLLLVIAVAVLGVAARSLGGPVPGAAQDWPLPRRMPSATRVRRARA